jgi:hypothetical protein
MISKILLYGLFSPIFITGIVAQFLVWELFSNGDWKTYNWRRQTRSPHVYQDQIESLSRQLEEERRDRQVEKQNLERQHKQELQALRRHYER